MIMSKEREELDKKKAENKKKGLKNNLLKAGGLLAAIALALVTKNKS